MLHPYKPFLRTVSVFLLLNILTTTLAPTISYALTAGPTAPESTSFEPVDTTDMVNLLTGDLAYNLPVLEVPGPEGGYAMSLSYHADPRPDEESSWVGLGWTLNPGAINRSVDGTPDDVRLNSVTQTRYVDQGGGTVQYVDVMGVKSGIGTIYTAHNFEGMGGMGSVALVNETSPDKTFRGSESVKGKQHDWMRKKMKDWLQLALKRDWIRPEEISPADTKYNMKVVPIPKIPDLYIDVKGNYWRWYKKYEGELKSKGALYASDNLSIAAENSSDAYTLFSNSALLTDETEADKFSYGTLPANDFYSVSAQGLSGTMLPYNFENGSLFLQNTNLSSQNDLGQYVSTAYRNCKSFSKKINFRFEGDFSNALSITPERIVYNPNIVLAGTVNAHALSVPPSGYNSTTQHLAGSRHVDWYTVNQVNNGYAKNKGFIKYDNIDNQNTSGTIIKKFVHSDTSTIAGFKIIGEDGTTYHYGLPVYAYDELSTIRAKGNNYARIESLNKSSYAYEWLLTAITGNDYVDRNNNGLMDNADWGYWTSFEYGKWTDKYMWRTPVSGFITDIDGSNEVSTSGTKELYYLDAIKTRTHTALFIKSIKADGKGVRSKDGGVGAVSLPISTGPCQGGQYNGNYYSVSIASMKLDKIYLLSNESLNNFLSANTVNISGLNGLRTNGSIYNDIATGQTFCSSNGAIQSGFQINYHIGDNVLDKNDLTASQFNDLKKASDRVIEFNTSYTLCPGTPNSFNVADNYANDIVFGNPLTKLGKLTLNSVKIYGRSGADLIPSYNFNYNISSNLKTADFRITQIDNGSGQPNMIYFGTTSPPGIEGGEVLQFTYNNLEYQVALRQIFATPQGPPGSGAYTYTTQVSFLGTNIPTAAMVGLSTMFHATETKNPGYGPDMLDMWGKFKPDYIKGYSEANINKRVSSYTLNSYDIWNLRDIETPIGTKIKITYEPDSYTKPKALNNYAYNITSMSAVSGSSTDVVLGGLVSDGTDLTTLFTVGSRCNFLALLQTPPSSGTVYEELLDYTTQEAEIIAVTASTITVRASNLVARLNGCYISDFSAPVGGTCSNTFIGGRLKYYKSNIKGGGLRVKSLAVEGSGLKKETLFNYESSPGITSGVTSFEPYTLDQYTLTFPALSGVSAAERKKKMAKGKDAYLKILYREFSDVLKFSRMLPAPGVMYEYITVTEKGNNVEYPVKVRYQFQVFDPYMINVSQDAIVSADQNNHKRNYINTIKNNTNRIGNLKSVLAFDQNGKMVKQVTKKYLHDYIDQAGFETALASLYNNQGKISQSFNNYNLVTVIDVTTNYYAYAVTNLMEEYPSILTKEESFDLVKGIKNEIQYLSFDFYSGQPTKNFYKNSYGEGYIVETVPAYSKYPEMGLKVNTSSNRHMLSQSAANYLYKADANATVTGTLSAEVTTWNKVWNYRTYNSATPGGYFMEERVDDPATVQNEQTWRPHRNYVLNSSLLHEDGTIQGYVDFNWSQEALGQPQHKYWQKNQEATLYDQFSNLIETVDLNGNYASTKLGYSGSEVLITATNSKFTEMAFTSAEDDALALDEVNNYTNHFGGEVSGKTYRSNTYAHTGKYSIALSGSPKQLFHMNKNIAGRSDFEFLKKYRASVWVHQDFITQARLYYVLINDGNNAVVSTAEVYGNTNLTKAGDWYLLPLDFSVPATALSSVTLKIMAANTGSGSVYVDDFRFHPQESSVNSYVYDPQTRQVTYILDNENFYTRFEYDPLGRLIATYKETINGEKKVNDYYYNYARKN